MYEIVNDYTTMDKLRILADAAKYDVACTSSGVDRKGKEGFLGNSCAAGICHSFAADGRCISLLKILMSNHCIHDCKYCLNRRSNDVERATFLPDEICKLVIEFYKRNYIEGLFLSSGVLNSPEHTMELICRTLSMLRNKYRFNGYIHVKAIPGAPAELLAQAGLLADRISLNLELPNSESLKKLAPGKNFNNIVKPMASISSTIAAHRVAAGKTPYMERSKINNRLESNIFSKMRIEAAQNNSILVPERALDRDLSRPFAPAGMSTQMIIGATPDTDLELITVTEQLYKSMDLKRVFYSAYVPLNDDAALPAKGTAVPLLREHRLYQADWLLRYYGFAASELLSPERPNFNEVIDPKCDWAVRHLDVFPVEVNTAPADILIRVPGIGPKSLERIFRARRYGGLTFDALKKMGVVLKRAKYFITCGGKMMDRIPIEERFIVNRLTDVDRREVYSFTDRTTYRQMSLFDMGMKAVSG
ncbi:MAG: putative DNA modification/repair radical SAM protein [Lachnospiraceae bacterium]|nr:putative DNA modification/repair radical SAM protein [Lachnospiraceae bacterium]